MSAIQTGTIEYCIKYARRHGCTITHEATSELAQLRAEVATLQAANAELETYSKLAVILNAVDASDVIGAVDSLYTQLRAQAADVAALRERIMELEAIVNKQNAVLLNVAEQERPE